MMRTASGPALSTQGLSYFRGDRCLFRGLDLSLGTGEILHLRGPNGVGKTSLMRVLAGLASPETGHVAWYGEPIERIRPLYQQNLAWLAHREGLKSELTVRENIRFDAALRLARPAGDTAEILTRLGIADRIDLPSGVLSAGQRRRVALARVLLSGAMLWMLDEPFTNLDAEGQRLVSSLMASHAAGGGLCVVAAHQALGLQGAHVHEFDMQPVGRGLA
jgi:heme exporter protein A